MLNNVKSTLKIKPKKGKIDEENVKEKEMRQILLSLFDHMKSILNIALNNPKYFVNSNILQERDNNVEVKKVLKINKICEEIEIMQVSILELQRLNKKPTIIEDVGNTPTNIIDHNLGKLKDEYNFDNEKYSQMKSLLNISSERRIGVYNDLFYNINKILQEVIEITGLNNDNDNNSVITKPIFKDPTNKVDEILDTLSDSSIEGHPAQVYVDILDLKKHKNYIRNGKRSNRISKTSSVITDSSASNESEKKEKISFPSSKIKNRKFLTKFANVLNFQSCTTMKDMLLYRNEKYNSSKYFNSSNNISCSSSNSDSGYEENIKHKKTILDLLDNENDNSLFFTAKEELDLGYRSS